MRDGNRELEELVDAPRERLDVEYKRWLDLSDSEVRATIARHLCAIANFGGGYLVFGIEDDMSSAGPCPAEFANRYDQDTISGIVKRYLKPAFQPLMYPVTSEKTGVVHLVVWIPSHGDVPVCSIRGGPQSGGKVVGIAQGVHYTRASGPESTPVTMPELWAPIIRRCVLHERHALLAGLEPLLRSPIRPVAEPDALLRVWHDAARRRFLELAHIDPRAEQMKRAHYQFSYQVHIADESNLKMSKLLNELRQMGQEVHDLVDPGWTMFWVFDVPGLAPVSAGDSAFLDQEFLECNLISPDPVELGLPDFWRVAPNGLATLVRPYREDRRDFGAGFERDKWFWPYVMGRELAEVIRHARAFAERFEAPESVSFRLEWTGLSGRSAMDPNNPLTRFRDRVAQSDSRLYARTVPIADLTGRWTELTADMLSSVTRMFDAAFSVSPNEVLSWSKRFRG